MKFSFTLVSAVLSAAMVRADQCDPPSGCSASEINSGNCPDACKCPCYGNMGTGMLVSSVLPGTDDQEQFCMTPVHGYTLVQKGLLECVEDCGMVDPTPCSCPQFKKKVEDRVVLDPKLPKPEKCVMKRGKGLLQVEPNFPAERPDVYIEVELPATGERFQFYPEDYPEYASGNKKRGIIPILDDDVFRKIFNEQEKKGGQGFKLRYVSKRGPGEWNSCKYTPIALDLNQDGVIDHITSETGFVIDITGDGDEEHLREWFSPHEGILIDAHNAEGLEDFSNGIITGDHLMGDMAGTYTDGFAKLATYDENCDDKLTGKELDGLYLWVDKNSNLKLDDDELFTLAHFDIVALSTIHDEMVSHAELSDGSKMMMQDLWFNDFEAGRRRLRQENTDYLAL